MQIDVFALVKNRLNTDKNSQLLYVKKQLAIKVAVYLTTENNKKCQNHNFTDLYVTFLMTMIFVIVRCIATKKSKAIPNTK